MPSQAISYLNRRSAARYKTRLRAVAVVSDRQFGCELIDISAGGAGVQVSPAVLMLSRQRKWQLEVPKLISVPAISMWQSGNRVGLRFDITPQRHQSIKARLEELDRTSDDIWVSED